MHWNYSTLSPVRPVTISENAHLGITVTFTVLFGLLFFIIFVEMLLLLYYKHKLFSYQSVFLFVCLIWSGLRLELFTFYYSKTDSVITYLPTGAYFALFALPVLFQYGTLTLLVLYFSRVWLKVKERADYYASRHYYDKARLILYIIWASLIVLMFAINLYVSLDVNLDFHNPKCPHHHASKIQLRVVITECLFLFNAFVLGYFVFKVYKSPSANAMLETQGTTIIRATFLSLLLMIVFLSRAVFNIVISSINIPCHSYAYDWFNASVEGDVGGDIGSHYVTFVFCIFFWELLPTVAIIFFFRIRQTSLPPPSPSSPTPAHDAAQARFFDNPKRYDSDADEDLPGPLPPFGFNANPSTPAIHPVYGSTNSIVQSSLPSPAYGGGGGG
eukprot:scpid78939/ scgid15363/ Integral membrane protein GPR137B